MAKAKVDLENVRRLAASIRDESNVASGAANAFSRNCEEARRQISNELTNVRNVISSAESGLARAKAELARAKEELEDLCARLASTPPTITVSYTDDDGYAYYTEEPNPEYVRLQEAVAEKQAEVDALQRKVNEYARLISDALEQTDILKSAYGEIERAASDYAFAATQVCSAAENAVGKLERIDGILQTYLGLYISESAELDTKRVTRDYGAPPVAPLQKTYSDPAYAELPEWENSAPSAAKEHETQQFGDGGLGAALAAAAAAGVGAAAGVAATRKRAGRGMILPGAEKPNAWREIYSLAPIGDEMFYGEVSADWERIAGLHAEKMTDAEKAAVAAYLGGTLSADLAEVLDGCIAARTLPADTVLYMPVSADAAELARYAGAAFAADGFVSATPDEPDGCEAVAIVNAPKGAKCLVLPARGGVREVVLQRGSVFFVRGVRGREIPSFGARSEIAAELAAIKEVRR